MAWSQIISVPVGGGESQTKKNLAFLFLILVTTKKAVLGWNGFKNSINMQLHVKAKDGEKQFLK